MIGEQTTAEERLSALLDDEVQHSNGLRKQVNELRRSLKYSRKDVARLAKEEFALRAERNKLRDWAVAKFNWFVDIHAEGKTPNMPWLIKDMTKLFNSVQPFYWG